MTWIEAGSWLRSMVAKPAVRVLTAWNHATSTRCAGVRCAKTGKRGTIAAIATNCTSVSASCTAASTAVSRRGMRCV